MANPSPDCPHMPWRTLGSVMSRKAGEAQGDWFVYPDREPFWYLCKFREADPDSISYQARFHCKDGNAVKNICLVLELPEHDFPGRELSINSKPCAMKPQKSFKLVVNNAKDITLRGKESTLVITGKFKCLIIYSSVAKKYQLRLSGSDANGMVFLTALNLKMSVRPSTQQELNLKQASAAVMGPKARKEFYTSVGLLLHKGSFNR